MAVAVRLRLAVGLSAAKSRGVITTVRLVHNGVSLAPGDEPAVDRHGDDEGNGESKGQRSAEQRGGRPASMAPGINNMMARAVGG